MNEGTATNLINDVATRNQNHSQRFNILRLSKNSELSKVLERMNTDVVGVGSLYEVLLPQNGSSAKKGYALIINNPTNGRVYAVSIYLKGLNVYSKPLPGEVSLGIIHNICSYKYAYTNISKICSLKVEDINSLQKNFKKIGILNDDEMNRLLIKIQQLFINSVSVNEYLFR